MLNCLYGYYIAIIFNDNYDRISLADAEMGYIITGGVCLTSFILSNWLFVASYVQMAYMIENIVEYKNTFLYERKIRVLTILGFVIILSVGVLFTWSLLDSLFHGGSKIPIAVGFLIFNFSEITYCVGFCISLRKIYNAIQKSRFRQVC